MVERHVEQLDEERPERVARGRVEKIARLETQERQVPARQIAAALAQVARDVTQHVGELEALAEAHAERGHLRRLPVAEPGPVGDVDVGPELPTQPATR